MRRRHEEDDSSPNGGAKAIGWLFLLGALGGICGGEYALLQYAIEKSEIMARSLTCRLLQLH